MTGRELMDTVASLGFSSEVPNEKAFLDAANLTLLRLNSIIPKRKSIIFYSTQPEPVAFRREGRNFSLSCLGAISFSFSYVGNVELSFTHNGVKKTEKLVNTTATPVEVSRVFRNKGELLLEFSGYGAYRVFNVAVFDSLTPSGDGYVYSERFVYDMARVPEFASIYRVSGGEYAVSGSKVSVPSDSKNEYTVEFNCFPIKLDQDVMELELEIDPMLSELAPLLCAYYVWLDDEPTKAENYRAEFDRALERALMRKNSFGERVVRNGW